MVTRPGFTLAEVIIANDARAGEREQAGDGFADHGGAQMADVHLLGGIRRGIVDDPGLAHDSRHLFGGLAPDDVGWTRRREGNHEPD